MGIPGNTAIRPALGQFADAGTFFSLLFSFFSCSLPQQGRVLLLLRPQGASESMGVRLGFRGNDENGIRWVSALFSRWVREETEKVGL
ncbi:hypothetical protein LX36DRAFT_64678 [Colletotrichum falcatum]|nr:hypothetical protein LX36DRAFT_64678 [Colletotrichum falcatum]